MNVLREGEAGLCCASMIRCISNAASGDSPGGRAPEKVRAGLVGA